MLYQHLFGCVLYLILESSLSNIIQVEKSSQKNDTKKEGNSVDGDIGDDNNVRYIKLIPYQELFRFVLYLILVILLVKYYIGEEIGA